LRVVIEL